jgi:hypothetical protein
MVSAERFLEVYEKACATSFVKYGIKVVEDTLEAPKTGEFNGQQIMLEKSMDIDEKMFLLVHLFGHNVQWLTSEKYRNIGLSQPEFADFEKTREKFISKLPAIFEYENVACRYGLQLLHDAGIFDMDEWVSQMAWADWLFLKESYVDGFKQENRDNFREKYMVEDYPIMEPIQLPEFELELHEARYAF